MSASRCMPVISFSNFFLFRALLVCTSSQLRCVCMPVFVCRHVFGCARQRVSAALFPLPSTVPQLILHRSSAALATWPRSTQHLLTAHSGPKRQKTNQKNSLFDKTEAFSTQIGFCLIVGGFSVLLLALYLKI